MSSQQSDLLSLYQDILRNLTVNWQRAFSPTINFGCNVQDINAEQHVLNEVGSYGSQLNRIIDLLSVLLPRVIDASSMAPTHEEQRVIARFEDLARRADEAACEYQNKPRHEITEAELDHVIQRMHALAHSDPAAYTKLLKNIHGAFPPPDTNAGGPS